MADKEYAPWSRETEDGLITSAVDSHVRVSQDIVPALAVGSIDKLSGKWEGVTVSDSLFLVDATHVGVPNLSAVLCPQSQPDYINMTNFGDLFIAIKPSNGGAFALQGIMGPNTNNFANLNPVNAASQLRGILSTVDDQGACDALFNDAAEALTADVWNIYYIGSRLKNQKLLQFKITNNSGGNSDIQFAYMRVV